MTTAALILLILGNKMSLLLILGLVEVIFKFKLSLLV